MIKKAIVFLIGAMTTFTVMADVTVTGTVVQATDGEPLIGASVIVKGGTAGVATNIDGNFTLKAPENSTLSVSYVGFTPQDIQVGSSDIKDLVVKLSEDNQMLDEVVVVGYGTQKKSVVTASIAKVTSEDLMATAPVRMDNALKGLAAGVNVTSASGQPGEGSKVRIRGNGTINNSDPLYIVDGMPIGGGLDFVNPNDIESIEVLKDAASAAIYGARAANGVILVTTKKGKQGNAKINYNFSYGWQSAWKKRAVTSATDYAILQNERSLNGGGGLIYADPYNLTDSNGDPITGFGTDWQDLVFYDNAPVMNHDISISGATEKLNYYLSLGYYTQDGIVGGNWGKSNYDRLTIRSNTNYTLFDESAKRSFLNKLDLGVNLAYMRTHSTGISTNSEFGSILGDALYMAPTLSPIATGETAQNIINRYGALYDLLRDKNGNLYTIPGAIGSYQEMNNPLADLSIPAGRNWSHKFVSNFNFDLQLWDNIKYRFSYAADMAFWGNENATLSKWILSGNNYRTHTEASMEKDDNVTWQIENTLSWNKTLWGKHTFGVVLGQSAMKYKGSYLGGNRWNLVNLNKPYMSYATGNIEYERDDDGSIKSAFAQFGVWGGPNTEHRMSSLFARLSYDFDGKYMFQGTIRRDGSSRFGSNNKYGTFPSVSAGWNIHRENFMEFSRDWLSNLKFRISWGKNGNDNIEEFAYTSLTAMGNNVLLGKDAIKVNGSKASRTPNPDLKWEESEQTDIGLDFSFFNNALTFSVDYFNKKTNGMIITMPIPSYVGETKPLGNVGDMSNKGVEFELGYRFNVADVQIGIKGNASYLKNTLKNLGNSEGFVNLDSAQGFNGTITRAENGLPFPFFYGYKTDGIFQTQDEVNSYVGVNGPIMPNAKPGDVRFVDVNGDGIISDDDRTMIGKGTPDWTYGLSINAFWRGFDFNIFFQGVSGNKIFDATYRTDVYSGNFPSWMLSRWTGPGTSNRIPQLRAGDTDNWKVSDLYVYDGSYCRLKNLTLGYTLPAKLTSKVSISQLRFYVMAENLATWTKYHGFDPEMSSGSTSLGVDRGIYPQARVWTIGLNLSF